MATEMALAGLFKAKKRNTPRPEALLAEAVLACGEYLAEFGRAPDGPRVQLVKEIGCLVAATGQASADPFNVLLRAGERALGVGAARELRLALRIGDTAAAMRTRSKGAWRLRGLALEALGRGEEAISAYERHLDLQQNPGAGQEIALRLATLRKVRSCLDEAVTLPAAPAAGVTAEDCPLRDSTDWPSEPARAAFAGHVERWLAERGPEDAAVRRLAELYATYRRLTARSRRADPPPPKPGMASSDRPDRLAAGPMVAPVPPRPRPQPPAVGASPGAGAGAGAGSGRELTGKRRIAFAAYVDPSGLPDLLRLLRSLALSNPGICEDFVVLHPGLPESSLDAARRLYPKIIARRAEVPSRLAVFQIDGYDTVIALAAGMVVLGDIGELLRMRHGVGAVPQRVPGALPGQSKERRLVLDGGLLVIQHDCLDAGLSARLDRLGSVAGAVEGVLVPLEPRYDFLASRLYDDLPVPDTVAILRFTEEADRPGYGPAQQVRRRFDLADEDFRTAYCALTGTHPELFLHCALPLLADNATVNLARAVAEVYRKQGRYQEAVDVLSAAVAGKVDRPRCHETLGVSLTAMSRYDAAETHLLLASALPDLAARAFGQLARLAWVRGADEAARRYASDGLDADPTDPTCNAMLRRVASQGNKAEEIPSGEQIAHVAFFAEPGENAGDRVLPEAVRMCLDTNTGPRRWLTVHAHRLFDEATLERVNAGRGCVVGGGGLFLPDTAPNGNSAWQWNVSDETLARISVPLAVFAVGYNIFDGQDFPRKQRFTDSLRALVQQSAFFGLRNRGSVDRVRDLLPAELRERVLFQPCPTTVARHLAPGWSDPPERADSVLLNCAYDRAGLRFGHDYGYFLGQLAEAVRSLREHADLRYVAHVRADETFVHDLRREHGITLPVERLYDASNAQILDLYRRTRLVIGMRGHASMIPFGCGTPVISLISHPKMAYFLSDIGRPEWGVSVHDRRLGARLAEQASELLNNHAAAVADVYDRQQDLWRVTQANIATLRKLFG